ncbi:hypothetical protein LCGC14_2172570 [marine sediment metagenome]|uniref:Uncharacterized protein n=1 Tax=marine sediment metagenome TaxID=412755 RepID=A0A0F9DPI1_9ZZZZ
MKVKFELRKIIESGRLSLLLDTFDSEQEASRQMRIEYETKAGAYFVKEITSKIIDSIK